MNVHIVVSKQNATRIVPRLAKVLADATGWSMSHDVDERADVNLFFPYLEYRPVATKTAAWFTHRDTSMPGKAELWDTVASQVDVRVTSADLYLADLRRHGPTYKATAPLDTALYSPPGERGSRRPVVGTSGFVYVGGRKGEELLGALATSDVGKDCVWTAIGRGWPIPTKTLTQEQVPAWYRQLDAYVCTSEIEGIGYGPLEALATGCPVVVPTGVGVFDELPNVPGICRYTAGDLDSMTRALLWALALRRDEPAMARLVNAVGDRSVERWALDWRDAVAGLQGAAPMLAFERHAMPNARSADHGVFIVAYGAPARECAQTCIAGLRKTNPDVPVALCSATPLGTEDVFIQHPDSDIGGRLAKVSIYTLAPADWQQVCYLDADTEPVQSIEPLFGWASDGWDLVICQNPVRFAVAANMKRPDNHDECAETFRLWGTDQMMQWNGGVFCFARNERVAAFFAAWRAEWQRYGKRDQGALLRALWAHPLKLWALTNTWNEVDRYQEPTQYTAIVHRPMTARRWTGIVDARGDSPQAWARVKK